MKFLGAQPKEIMVLFDISISQLEKLKWALDHSTIDYDSNNEIDSENVKYIQTDLYTTVVESIAFVKQQFGIPETQEG